MDQVVRQSMFRKKYGESKCGCKYEVKPESPIEPQNEIDFKRKI
jgi:hypothetical protein